MYDLIVSTGCSSISRDFSSLATHRGLWPLLLRAKLFHWPVATVRFAYRKPNSYNKYGMSSCLPVDFAWQDERCSKFIPNWLSRHFIEYSWLRENMNSTTSKSSVRKRRQRRRSRGGRRRRRDKYTLAQTCSHTVLLVSHQCSNDYVVLKVLSNVNLVPILV